MIILPAIDLLGGKCVRLRQGKYDDVTVYRDDPMAQAMDFVEAGSKWIHIVDLDAARLGIPTNHKIIKEIASETGLKVETGGGIRNMDTLKRWIEDYGVTRCVIGTSAIKDRAFTEKALKLYSDNIAIGIDAHDGEVAVDGWTKGGGVKAVDFAFQMKELGAKTIIFTDISRDGMLTGPAFDSTKELVDKTGLNVIASGGIGSNEDVFHIKDSGCAGVIIGKAIYEGKVDLTKCMQNV
ncbi:MAG: 1-(5-phosphoribosyl)-5-[(5-phosphoribosylamino)methylideneamino]imidazole-4-carboxamide isomerase [Clostridiales bacterium]|nr:1-(5-phosphoribosyl)-5-[(5-phosphoribosylamino)methylideneamino]imidazole-4-carboxamide isomerase [Clostridiales bacterium]